MTRYKFTVERVPQDRLRSWQEPVFAYQIVRWPLDANGEQTFGDVWEYATTREGANAKAKRLRAEQRKAR
jgi:hypothetical protein